MSVNEGSAPEQAVIDAPATGLSIGAGGVQEEGGSVSIGVDLGYGSEPIAINEARTAFEKLLPETAREKEWIKNSLKSENPLSSIIDQYENAQKLIGKPPANGLVVPGPEATPEQIKAFHTALGVPEDVKAYKYVAPTFEGADKELGEQVTSGRDPAFMEQLFAVAQKEGITPAQVQALAETHDRLIVEQYKALQAASANAEVAKDQTFDQLSDKWFGTNKNKVLTQGREMMEATLPAEMRPFIAQLPPEALVVMAAAFQGVRSQYVKEDGFSKQAGVHSTFDPTAIKSQIYSIMAQPEYEDDMNTASAGLRAKVQDLYKQLGTSR